MITNYNESRNYTGIFFVNEEEFRGEFVYNRESGKIALNLAKELEIDTTELYKEDPDQNSYTLKEFTKKFDYIEAISGKLDFGPPVVLFNCKCTTNTIFGNSRDLKFQAEYMVWNDAEAVGRKYTKFICVLENVLPWGEMTQIELGAALKSVEFIPIEKYPQFDWYGAKITFGTSLDRAFSLYKEETRIIERLQFAIKAEEEKDISFFLDVRDKIISMISYAIKDNVNIANQYLIHKDDVVVYPAECGYKPDHKVHYKYNVLTNEPLKTVDPKSMDEYNFTLSKLPQDSDLAEKLGKLIPIFNLYLSRFKYVDMPIEMKFLNLMQAVETFHARFFYADEDNVKFQKDIEDNYKETPLYEYVSVNGKGGKKVVLAHRFIHLLVSAKENLLQDFCNNDGWLISKIINTRNYYTHYNPLKEDGAYKARDLVFVNDFLALILEYHINEQLNIQLDDGSVKADNEDEETERYRIHYNEYARYIRRLRKTKDYIASKLLADTGTESI